MTEDFLGRPLSEAGNRVTLDAEVTRDGEGWALDMVVRTDSGEDRFSAHASSCDPLVEAAALKLALTIDTMAVVDEVEVPGRGEPEPEPVVRSEPEPAEQRPTDVVEPAPVPSVEPPSPSDPPAEWDVVLGIAGLAGYGIVQGWGGGPEWSVGFGRGWWRIDPYLGYSWSQSAAVGSDGAGVALQMGAAGVRTCGRPAVGRVGFPICVLAEAGVTWARGYGLPAVATAARPRVVAGVAPGVRVALSQRIAMVFRTDVLLSVLRPRFVVEGQGDIYTAPIFAFRAGLGLEITLK